MDLALSPWLREPWQNLVARRMADRMPHAVLIHGPAGLLKLELARATANLLLCRSQEQAGCGSCPPCKWFAAGSHPDFAVVEPSEDSQFIRVDQIRALSQSMSLTSSGPDGYRVALIHPADSMNAAACNALLKTLEEPPGRACLILVADTLRTLPATVLSRCQRVAINVPPLAQAVHWLEQEVELESKPAREQIDHALFLAGGSPRQAALLIEQGATAAFAELLDGLADLRRGQAEVTRVAQKLGKVPMQWILSWMLLILRQCLAHGAGYVDIRPIPQALDQFCRTHAIAPDQVNRMTDQVLRTRRGLSTSLRPELLIEDLLCDWAA